MISMAMHLMMMPKVLWLRSGLHWWIGERGSELPWKVFLPVHLIIAKIKSVLGDQPEAGLERATSSHIPLRPKRVELLPRRIPFHGAPVESRPPQTGLHAPAVIVAHLKRPPPHVLLPRRTPDHQSQRWIVGEPVHYPDVVPRSHEVFGLLQRRQYYEGSQKKRYHKHRHPPHDLCFLVMAVALFVYLLSFFHVSMYKP